MVVIGMCIVSMGMGLTMSPATNSIMGSLPVNKAGVGSAMNDTTRMLGGALGVAMLGTIMNSVYISKIDALSGTLSSQAFAVVRSSIQGAHIVAGQMAAAGQPVLAKTILDSANQAFVSGMARGLMIAGIIMVVASLVTFVILPMRVRPAKEEEQATGVPETAKGP
jgi:hypothetical protein